MRTAQSALGVVTALAIAWLVGTTNIAWQNAGAVGELDGLAPVALIGALVLIGGTVGILDRVGTRTVRLSAAVTFVLLVLAARSPSLGGALPQTLVFFLLEVGFAPATYVITGISLVSAATPKGRSHEHISNVSKAEGPEAQRAG